MSSEHGNFSSFTRGYRGGARFRPDYGNRHYVRGGRGRGDGSAAPPHGFPSEANLKKGLDTSKVIETILAPPRPSALEDVPIENVQYVASYNWVDKEEPTIVVPGTRIPSRLERLSLIAVGFPLCRFAGCLDRTYCPVYLAAR
jgi:hypothetical protein